MRTSESIISLAPAMVSAQAEIDAATKDKSNPAYKSQYATLAAVVDASRPALTTYGVAVIQSAVTGEGVVTITTRLLHKSGEWIEDDLTLPVLKWDAQGIGSAITYGRRYGYSAMVGVVADDDDGNAASQKGPVPVAKVQSKPTAFDDWLTQIEAVADEGTEALSAAWRKSPAAMRDHLLATDTALWERIKAKASKVVAHA